MEASPPQATPEPGTPARARAGRLAAAAQRRHPVPFGAYLPVRSVLTKFVKRFNLVPYDQVAGHRPGVPRLGLAVVGGVTCFEVVYGSAPSSAIRGKTRRRQET